jgi:hypothetical protein
MKKSGPWGYLLLLLSLVAAGGLIAFTATGGFNGKITNLINNASSSTDASATTGTGFKLSVAAFSFNDPKGTYNDDGTFTLAVTLNDDAAIRKVTWESDDTDQARIKITSTKATLTGSEATIALVAPWAGTELDPIITARGYDGTTATCTVSYYEKIETASATANTSTGTLFWGQADGTKLKVKAGTPFWVPVTIKTTHGDGYNGLTANHFPPSLFAKYLNQDTYQNYDNPTFYKVINTSTYVTLPTGCNFIAYNSAFYDSGIINCKTPNWVIDFYFQTTSSFAGGDVTFLFDGATASLTLEAYTA